MIELKSVKDASKRQVIETIGFIRSTSHPTDAFTEINKNPPLYQMVCFRVVQFKVELRVISK